MFIVKNALKCISRSKGRNILIGIIALVIAVSACIGLSIRQAAENAKTDTLEGLSVTATISFDRQSMMSGMGRPEEGGKGGFDRDQFKEVMGSASALTLSDYETYAGASSVEDFYYTLTASVDGSEGLEPVTTDEETANTTPSRGQGGMKGGFMGGGMPNGDFSIVGYSRDAAMTDFASGVTSVLEGGAVFEEGTTDLTCIISEELATFNSLSVGNTVTVTNPNKEDETYTLTVVGIYTSTETNDFGMSAFGAGQDPANRIYMSAAALQTILDASEKVSTTATDENGREYETAVTGSLNATYVFANTEDYYLFEEEVRTLGLSDSYTVSSTDVTAFENSLIPLNTLSTMAGWFLLVILIIGAIILIVLNIFNVRERKYEIGVLTAMGMKKGKVALQFMVETLVVMMTAIILGAAIGAVSSVPVTNALLAGQIESQQSQQTQMDNNFGRPGNMGGGMGGEAPAMPDGETPPDMGGDRQNPFREMFGGAIDYVSEIDSAMNLTVVWQLLGIGLLLTLVASVASILFVMRYDPLKILANRD